MYDEGVVEDEPKSTFVTYLAEGDKLCNAALYEKALESYNTVVYSLRFCICKLV